MAASLRPAMIDRDRGHRLWEVLQDPPTQQAVRGLDDLVPGFADWIVTSLFGGTYQRSELSLRDRQLINLAALATLGDVDPQLAGHVRTGLRVGLTREQIVEVFVHLAPYIGVPRALAALRVVGATLASDAVPARDGDR
ncbi:carboxymuconolactone decarboxylase family protein [Actinocatenispora sera]|uniref:Carboxymuconolactone decarboxylase n=1 Tax=Actinocatenispora sera TaxID=390989 RepID=A0A810L630_9ACTN|nr:carboxymuconolactone decarboxylase family protein [Actinocatenispora sera]BCJ30954.1 carboxymuconolactone decarboxylase [Actinocatenispora sera]